MPNATEGCVHAEVFTVETVGMSPKWICRGCGASVPPSAIRDPAQLPRCVTCSWRNEVITLMGRYHVCGRLSPDPAITPLSDSERVEFRVSDDFGCVLWEGIGPCPS